MKIRGRKAFEDYYASVYGARWSGLLAALELPRPRQVARANPFAESSHVRARAETLGLSEIESGVYEIPEGLKLAPATDGRGILDFYVMDPASILVAKACAVGPEDRVLDLCAAPGGKSLILAQNAASIVANEFSRERRARLRAVLDDYLPAEVLARVEVTGHDGAKWCLYETEAFDRVLVDAPCSGERHLLANRAELEVWSPARSKNLAIRQYALLVSALAVVRRGGRVVYSTCSISPLENDGVVAKLLKKRPGQARIVRFEGFEAEIEPTEHGSLVLPDRAGRGPIYFSVIERLTN